MRNRFPPYPALMALLAFAACEPDAATGPETVRLALVADAAHGGALFQVGMTQEVTSQPVYAGDPDGTGTALITVNVGQRELCFELSASGITLPATASHIHRAPTGVRGGIVVHLTPPDASGEASGCVTGLDRVLLRDILTNPAGYYVNVHTADYPPGAVRGQLGR